MGSDNKFCPTKISIILPAYNEGQRIYRTMEVISNYFKNKFPLYEIAVVDDGSFDNTKEEVKRFITNNPDVKVLLLSHPKNLGKGAAVKTGMLNTESEIKVFTDVDLSTPIESFEKFKLELDKGYSIVIGNRHSKEARIRKHQPKYREILGKFFTILANLILGTSFNDFTCGFKVFSHDTMPIFKKLILNDWSFDAEVLFLAKKYGYKISELPVEWKHEEGSKVKIFRDAVKSFMGLLKIRFTHNFEKKSLKYFYLFIGGIACILLNSTGLNFITPGIRIRNIVFENENNVKDNLLTMVQEREIIKKMITTAWAEYFPSYNPRENLQFYYNKKPINIERNIFNGMRSYLLRTMAPDEGILKSLERMKVKKFNFNPHYFAYGGFYIYSEGAYLAILKILKILNIKRDTGYYLLNPQEMGKIFIALRAVNAFLSVGSFFLIFLIGYRLQGQWHGIISSLLFIFTPGIVIWNHFARPHIFSLFWILLAVYFFIKVVQNEKWEIKNFVLGCVFTGLTMSILLPYGMFISFLIPITLFLCKLNSNQISITKYIFIGIGIVISVFLITNPYILFSINEVIAEYKFTKMDVQYRPSLHNYYYYLTTVLKIHLGVSLWALFLLCLPISFYKPKKEEWLIIFPFIAGFILFGTSYPNYLLRFVFFLPFVVLITGNGLVKIMKIKKLIPFAMVIFALCFFYTMLYTLAYLRLFVTEDTRYIAGEWINANIPVGTSIGLKEPPVAFRTPPFSFAKYKIVIVDTGEKFQKEIPEYFVTSSFDWRFSSYEEMKNYLSGYYKEFKVFKKVPHIFNIKFNIKNQRLPPDYCYFNPVIIIWKRQ